MNVQKVFCKLFTLYHATQFLCDNEKKVSLYNHCQNLSVHTKPAIAIQEAILCHLRQCIKYLVSTAFGQFHLKIMH